ncbi:single hybrid motif-containing protein [Cristinia sonorae]|uniref:Single hybrid motif-containing protein n=1 Tax=Cristinia sonorae TaxID=1940300 RepID=A0A8K0XPR8_9AGAR|nr:single hybrid motif-containing protein [Cristinia sonorae]
MSACRAAARISCNAGARRMLHASATRRAVTQLQMPALSPTMTQGGVSIWKKKEGESFSTGDVLLEIETDKATLDLDAQEDGILAKILVPEGAKNIAVGSPIALLAEEGDDLSNLEIPKEALTKSAPEPQQQSPPPSSAVTEPTPAHSEAHAHPKSSRPLFPSVLRLLTENGISEADKIKGTGVRGMITKGDVLTFLGKASGPLGTYQALLDKEAKEKAAGAKATGGGAKVEKKPEPLDGPSLRRAIVTSMLDASIKARNPPPPKTRLDFDAVLADYLPKSCPPPSSPAPLPIPTKTPGTASYLDGLF